MRTRRFEPGQFITTGTIPSGTTLYPPSLSMAATNGTIPSGTTLYPLRVSMEAALDQESPRCECGRGNPSVQAHLVHISLPLVLRRLQPFLLQFLRAESGDSGQSSLTRPSSARACRDRPGCTRRLRCNQRPRSSDSSHIVLTSCAETHTERGPTLTAPLPAGGPNRCTIRFDAGSITVSSTFSARTHTRPPPAAMSPPGPDTPASIVATT